MQIQQQSNAHFTFIGLMYRHVLVCQASLNTFWLASHDFKSLTNLSSGICQNKCPSNENAMDVGEKKNK